MAGCCECGDEPSGSCATELVCFAFRFGFKSHNQSVNYITSKLLFLRLLELLLRIREVTDSNLGSDTGYIDEVYLSLSSECRDSTLKLGHDRFLPNTFQFIVHLSPFYSTLCSINH
jgi:hypothetical protein